MTLLALIIGGWFILGVLVVVVLNLAKWAVRSTSASAARADVPQEHWPAPHWSAPTSRPLPHPYAGGAVSARRSGIGSNRSG